MNLRDFQREQADWAARNFGFPRDRDYRDPLMGVVEEVGELSHAFLKQRQEIRGSWEEHEAKAMDAVGDAMVYLADLCTLREWDLDAILERTWTHVKSRDWRRAPEDGAPSVANPAHLADDPYNVTVTEVLRSTL